jgi:hypothetical protein
VYDGELTKPGQSSVSLDAVNLTCADGLTAPEVAAARLFADARLPVAIAADPAVVARIAEMGHEDAEDVLG